MEISKKSNQYLTNQVKDIIPIPPHNYRNIQIIPRTAATSKNKDKRDNCKMKFAYIPKYNSRINLTDNNSNNIVDSKNISRENFKELNKESSFSNINNNNNNNGKHNDIVSIFDAKKLLIKNNENINTPKNNMNNLVYISNNRKYNNCKSNIIIQNKNNRQFPQRYQLHLESYPINNINSNNNLFANKKNIYHYGNNRIIKIEEKYKKILENREKGRKLALENISITSDKKKPLQKCLSKPNCINDKNFYINNNTYTYTNNSIKNNNNTRIENIDALNSEKMVKHKSIRTNNNNNNKNNNFYYYQTQVPKKEILNKNKKSNIKSYTINNKNHSQTFERNNSNYMYPRDLKINKKSEQNIEKEKNMSKNKNNAGEMGLKNQVNNNNININNVFINLDNKNKTYFSNERDIKPFIREELNHTSLLYNKSNSNKELNINNFQILKDIKLLWKKIGGVTEYYKINFIDKIKYLNNEEKLFFYMKEKEDTDNLINLLDKLNKDINNRNNINTQLKSINFNNCMIIEEITKLLLALRMSTIDVINDFINFKKAISYELINNKYILNNINNFPYNYLTLIENDNNYLNTHEYLSTIYKFSRYSDPFLLCPSRDNKDKNSKFVILPIDDFTLEEIKKANYFLMKEKMNRDDKKRSIIKSPSPSNYCNNSIFITTNNTAKKVNEKKIRIYIEKESKESKEKKLENAIICSKINTFDIINNSNKLDKEKITICKNSFLDIINNNVKTFDKNIDIISNVSNFKIIDDNKNKNIFPCSNIVNIEIINTKNNNINDICQLCNISNFEIKSIPKTIKQNYLINFKNENFEIIKKNEELKELKEKKLDKNKNIIIPCVKVINIEIIQKAGNLKNQQNNNIQKPINQGITNQVCSYNEKSYPPLELLYNAYFKTVNNDIKISFKIMPDIFYYSTIGASPKILLFKQNESILYGMATLSYDSSQIYHRALMITSISCSNNYSITKTLLKLVDYCDREIEYDELILYLYFYQSETNKCEYILNEEYKNMIKTQTKFKWTALENTGNERKIKYHYKKSFSLNKKDMINQNMNIIKMVKNYTQIRFYRLIKYNKTNCEKGFTTKEHTFLFNVLYLIFKYGKEPDNKEDELNIMFSKISGLKKKRLLKMITEFNYVIYNKVNDFVEELGKNENKIFSEILFKRFLPLIQNLDKTQFLGLFYCDISTNFSCIFKKKINYYEYNIISNTDLNIEVFRLSNDQNNEDFNNFLYFFKSENESISFILYELNSTEEKNMESNNNENEIYKNDLFNKLLKRILTKDNDEPAKYYKKIGIPSFRYHPPLEKENVNQYKISDYDILDGDDWFDFCIENNKNENLFSFPDKNIINENVKIIENSFVISIINPDLTVDYHIPALNIYYIDKKFWIKR